MTKNKAVAAVFLVLVTIALAWCTPTFLLVSGGRSMQANGAGYMKSISHADIQNLILESDSLLEKTEKDSFQKKPAAIFLVIRFQKNSLK